MRTVGRCHLLWHKLNRFPSRDDSFELSQEQVRVVDVPHMNFSYALALLKDGKRMRRECWPAGMYAYVMPVDTGSFLAMPGLRVWVAGQVLRWLPDVGDVFAEDWERLIEP